jgi:drug/metabolite transporter (DMT)-like permease
MKPSGPRTVLVKGTPVVFVLLWASGFVVARLVRPYAEPESFLSLRFALSAIILATIAVLGGARWPRTHRAWGSNLVTGALMQGAYVGGVFWAVRHGVSAALAALISGLQPLLTGALAGPLLAERVSARRWLGILLGFSGAGLVIAPQLVDTKTLPAGALLVCFGAMVAITLGTIWQKRTGATIDLRAGAAIQFIGGLMVTVPLALVTEHQRIANNRDVWLGLGWGVVMLSVVTALLLLTLIRQGAVAKVTSLFYLVPPVTALMALALFGEGLVPLQILGMAVAAGGVLIANRG